MSTKLMWRINPAEELHAFGMQISGRASPFGIDEEDLEAQFYINQASIRV